MRNILIAILVIILCISFSCKRNGSNNQITLTVYNYRDITAPDAFQWDLDIKKFGELHPEISLIVEEGFNDPYHQKLHALAQAGKLPDLVFLWPGKKTGFVTERGLIKDLRPWLRGHEDKFKPFVLAPQGPNGEIYELPDSIEICHVMYANDRLMKSLGLTFPETLEELIEQGEVIRQHGLIPIAMANKDGWQMQSSLLSTLIDRTGGQQWWEKVIAGDRASFADPQFVRALKIIKSLYDNGMFSPGINHAAYEQSMNDFVHERAVYYIDGGWKTSELVVTMSEEQQEYISLHSFPDVENQKGVSGSIAAVPGCGFGMNAKLNMQKADAAWKWIWFYSGPMGIATLHQQKGAVTAFNTVPQSEMDVLFKKLMEFCTDTKMTPVIDNVMDVNGVMEILQTDIHDMMFDNITPEQVAQNYENWVRLNDSNRLKQ